MVFGIGMAACGGVTGAASASDVGASSTSAPCVAALAAAAAADAATCAASKQTVDARLCRASLSFAAGVDGLQT